MTVRFSRVMRSQKPATAASVRLPAVIDEQAADAIRAELRRLIVGTSGGHIELDAQDLRLISPRGLGVLAAVALAVRRRGVDIDIVNCPPRLLGVLKDARLAADPREAVAAASPGADDLEVDWTPWWRSAAANA
jgi:anti-anti-sigma factor